MENATVGTAARGEWARLRRWWFLTNLGILYGITLAAACAVVCVGLIVDSTQSVRWGWLWAIPLVGVIGVGITVSFTFPAFTLYLVGLRLARRRWPSRLTAWLLTPLLSWAVFWTWPTADGKGSWWGFGIALVCVAAAAALVRI